MNRRATIASLLGKQSKKALKDIKASDNLNSAKRTSSKKAEAPPVLLSAGLDPYTGPFDFAAAAHLLRRVTFGPTKQQIEQAVQDGLEVTMQKVFSNPAINELPLNPYYESDPNCAIGETWIDKPYVLDDQIRQYRRQSIFGWTIELMLEDHISIREKMTLFWHNHFVTSDIDDPNYVYNYSNRLRTNALGNFRDFTKEMVIDPSMLRYLNGNQNIASSPNENFARELLELFTIGKGDIAGPGDYTYYTEEDIQVMSKVLTGWKDVGYFSIDTTQPGAEFNPANHDNSTKTLSHRFGNAQISNGGENEYETLVDIILQQDEVAKFIVRKIYRWFIYYGITDDVEQNIITPLAQIFRDGNYEIQPVLETLFRSEHFFGEEACGCIIKNPMDYIVGLVRQFEMKISDDLALKYQEHLSIAQNAAILQMTYYGPPSVAGWKPYYQEPAFHQIWLNSVTLPQRMAIAYLAVNVGFEFGDERLIIDPLPLVNSLATPADVNALIDDMVAIFLPKPITEGQKIYLKAVLIPGLPDFEWEVEYLEYTTDPDNEALAAPVRSKLRNMITVIITMAEYQLM